MGRWAVRFQADGLCSRMIHSTPPQRTAQRSIPTFGSWIGGAVRLGRRTGVTDPGYS